MNKTPWAPGAAALADAARALATIVVEGRSSDAALSPYESSAHRAAVRAITLGSVRWYLRLAPAVDSLLTRPKGVAAALHALLVASAHQIEYSRNPPQVTVHAAVDAARILKEERATGLVNAVLRRFVGERAALLAGVDSKLAARTAHPAWLVERLEQAWGSASAAILEANNAHPPMVLRVDLTRQGRDQYLSELQAAGIAARPLSWLATAIELDEPIAVSALPGFAEGRVSVQDAGAQLAAPLLAAEPGMRVLDACAAPGGKTGHLLERTPGIAELVAVDIDAQRVGRIEDNLRRSNRTARLVVADVRRPERFWDGRPFDRILLDAPCSSTGVIRRHPDIKLLRRRADVPALAAAQLEILRAAFGLLGPGGRLLYCTCSVLPDENQAVVERFLAAVPAARTVPLPPAEELAPGALAQGAGVQLLPGTQAGSDGFYYACLEKTTAGT
ncbi:MAG TPA: 16S rRNA (cytosine(967)-C(5))-methyltransferase RsmB [Steroidobacteraceae bacterium]|nr:16S rRNA (cytosine(967)-C(5))-methyltransferase RsmB [Steroidobacteraceae bacterium]